MSSDLILHNAKIATNGNPSLVEAMAIKAGKITAIGTSGEVIRTRWERSMLCFLRGTILVFWPQPALVQ